MKNYQSTRNTRRESRTLVGRFRGGKLFPVLATAVRGSEGGLLSQNVTLELDPIAGRLITPITAEMYSVFVSVQAIDAIISPENAYSGMTDVIREKLLTGNPLFVTEAESDISKACGVNPRRITGVARVNQAVRIAHNAAVNFLRQRKYSKAAVLLHSNTAITPALIAQTVLDRMNGVLDPEDRVNGAVALQIPNMVLPVEGIRFTGAPATQSAVWRQDGNWSTLDAVHTQQLTVGFEKTGIGASMVPHVTAKLNGATAGAVNLVDFYNAQTQDRLVRTMREIADENPEYGDEMILRWAHGLSVDPGRMPILLAEKTVTFGRNIVGATDTTGVQDDVIRSDMAVTMGFTVPVPSTELGGIIVTFCTVKPDETISAQPHPILSDVWGLDNFVADELALDPVPVTVREMDADCAQAQEATVLFYTGLNALKATYVHYGLSRRLDPATVENKTAVWQLEIPMSVTPENILYPASLDHFPFADQNAEVCTYTVSSNLVLRTPMIFGPTPVEELAIIETADIFEDAP
ncbi:hypothetical protein [Rhodobacter ferrooxidans]|uniref:Major capsid protein n=1 Tax=Rhodobacter ferrooxidans TaxID=371731 RepID=C8RZ57_9RHOB|nr:hypothetical protein [Rhodobacter sp. SW2]EEW26014.1 hypothetical protein Rsw2DRAFT_1085 [Rhodobacter sp. SW2]